MKNILMYVAQSFIGMTLLGILYFFLFVDFRTALGSLGQLIMNIVFYKL